MKTILATIALGLAAFSSGAFAATPSDPELEELGLAYALAVNQRDTAALDTLVSAQHLAENIVEIAGDSPEEKKVLLATFKKEIPTINSRMLVELDRQNTSAIYLRIHEFDGMRGPLVRYNVGGGYNYVLLIPVSVGRTDSQARIGDLYFATSGELMSETVGIATQLASSPSETFLGKLFGVDEINRDFVSQIQQVAKLRQENRLREAYDVLDQTEGGIRNHRLVLMNTIQIASQLDEALYRKELRRLAEHHNTDPRVAFTLLDHYFYENQLDKAMSIIDLMAESYGDDGVFNLLRANVEFARGRIDAARGYARKSVQLEPNNEDAHWTLLTTLVQSEMYAESVTELKALESGFGYAFARENFDGEPLYAEFIKSDEFAQWIDAP